MSEFVTQNRSLAIALHGAGVPMYLRNEYTPELLAKWGFKLATEAVAAGRPGKVVFYLTRVSRLDDLIAIYNEQANASTDQDMELPDEMPLDERVVRVICHSQKIRQAIERALWNPVYAWEIHGGDFSAIQAFEAKEAAIRKKLADRPNDDPKDFLSSEEYHFITTPHTINVELAKVINATMGPEKRKHMGL